MRFEELAERILSLKDSEVGKIVRERIEEFKKLGREGDEEELFSELCFCILTANFSAEGGIRIQRALGPSGFLGLGERELEDRLRRLGHRFPSTRAKYIVEARRWLKVVPKLLRSGRSSREIRRWLVENVKGIGMKEASHFLRNVGFMDVAILDYHVLDVLERYDVVSRPKTLTPKRYEEIESKLEELAEATGLSLGELDLYLWYLETGKVLK